MAWTRRFSQRDVSEERAPRLSAHSNTFVSSDSGSTSLPPARDSTSLPRARASTSPPRDEIDGRRLTAVFKMPGSPFAKKGKRSADILIPKRSADTPEKHVNGGAVGTGAPSPSSSLGGARPRSPRPRSPRPRTPVPEPAEKANFFDVDESTSDVLTESPEVLLRQLKEDAKERIRMEKESAQEEDLETVGGAFVDEERTSTFRGGAGSPESMGSTSPVSGSLRETMSATPTRQDHIERGQHIADLEAEVEALKRSQWSSPSIGDVVNRILLGQSCSLDWFRSMEQKLELLDAALETFDGNCIMTVLLFLKKTLDQNCLLSLLHMRPPAAKHYCSFLKQLGATKELSSFYSVLNYSESAGYLKLHECESISDPRKRADQLRICHMYFKNHRGLEADAGYVEEYAALTDKQRVIHEQDSHSTSMSRVGGTVLFQPMTTTLFYCCRYHGKEKETYTASPELLRRKFSIPERLYFQVSIAALCCNKDWPGVELLLINKRVLGVGRKRKSPIGFERVVTTLHKYKAPEEEMRTYLDDIDSLEDRLRVATEVGLYDIGISTLRELKDRARLRGYINEIPPTKQREHRKRIETLLSNNTIKWKTQ